MKFNSLSIPDVMVLEPTVFHDERGFLFESFHQEKVESALGNCIRFVQDNNTHSVGNVLRGLHYQLRRPQGKLVRVVAGEIFDVAVDLRRASATRGKWVAEILSARNRKQLWIPPGFAHGFLVLSASADILYKTTDYYSPRDQRTIAWDDPRLAIHWPATGRPPVLSARDSAAPLFSEAELP